MGYSEEDKLNMLRLYHKNKGNVYKARMDYRILYPDKALPSKNTFRNVDKHIANNLSLRRKKRVVAVNEEEELDILLHYEGNN